jgi:hypothetical protein
MKEFRLTAGKTKYPVYVKARSLASLNKRLGPLRWLINVSEFKKK